MAYIYYFCNQTNKHFTMRHVSIILLISLISFACTQQTKQNNEEDILRTEANALLKEWMDTMLTYQCQHHDKALDGSILCPACARVHGRIGDAVLPLMYLADYTKDEKYLNAAKNLMKWMENVHQPDGGWMNDVNVSAWNGTTVFAAIALYEALHHHQHLLDDSTANHWKKRLEQAGDFIMNNPFIYSRNRTGMRNMNVNYSASATYALYALGEMFGRDDFKKEAKVIAKDIIPYFTENNHFLYGEGPNIWTKTKNGCRPVDLLYNIEESLPNMVYYTRLSGDKELENHIEQSFNTHLEFMLPDGAWDNSWGTRSFKWTYWGGRTSDGFMGGYYSLAQRHPEYLEAIYRNVQLLKQSTHNGLLHAGKHYQEANVYPCIHHTFGHAKALASFLEQDYIPYQQGHSLPRDAEYGQKFMLDINTWLVAQGSWRATITGYDAEYKKKGTHPMGGVLSMLWHKKAGPIFASTMNKYFLLEAPNMQVTNREFLTNGSPRIELMKDNTSYTNLDDLNTTITASQENGTHSFDIESHLVDIEQNSPRSHSVAVSMNYTISSNSIALSAHRVADGAYMVLPVISSSSDQVKKEGNTYTILQNGHSIVITCQNGDISIDNTDKDGRIFNPVPGFSFIPFKIQPCKEKNIKVKIDII